MCVLYACVSKKPSFSTLRENQVINDDGNGYAYLKKGIVHWRKGIKTAWELSDAIQNLPYPLLVHQRMQSAGTTHPGLSHPFPVNRQASIELVGTAREVLAHNGTIFNWRSYMTIAQKKFGLRVKAGDEWSDTRLLAWLMWRLDRETMLKLLGKGQRIALLDAQGIRIHNPELWWKEPHQTNGYWQSSDYSGFVGFGSSMGMGGRTRSFEWAKSGWQSGYGSMGD